MQNFGNHSDLQLLASSSPVSVLSQRTDETRDRRSQLVREERYEREMGECSFQPQINNKSQKIVREKRLREALEVQRMMEVGHHSTPARGHASESAVSGVDSDMNSTVLVTDAGIQDNSVADAALLRTASPKGSGLKKSEELYEHAKLLRARRGEYEKLMEQAHSFSFKTSLKKQRRASIERRKESSRSSFFERMHRVGAERAQRIGKSRNILKWYGADTR